MIGSMTPLEETTAYKELVGIGLGQGLEQGRGIGLEQGMEKGMEKGMEQGLEQGLEQGRILGAIDNLEQLLTDGTLTKEQFQQKIKPLRQKFKTILFLATNR